MKKCVIVSAGDFFGMQNCILKEDLVIAADGGLDYLAEENIIPDIVIGDMDSVKDEKWNRMIDEKKTKCIKLPREKDDTDTLAAIKEGMKNGYDHFELYGVLGGRLDHTIANIQCLMYLQEHGAKGIIYGDRCTLELVCNDKVVFDKERKGTVSVFAFGGNAKGVTERGLKYCVEDIELETGYPLGVSNEFTGQESMIEVKEGAVLVYTQE